MRSEQSTRPFEVMRIDCCGHLKIQVECKNPPKTITKEVHAVTMVDDATTWPEVAQLEGNSAYQLARHFDAQWLCRYTRPNKVIYDNGGDFIGREFQKLLCSYTIQRIPTTVMNPQSNGIKERMHLTMADMLRTCVFSMKDDRDST